MIRSAEGELLSVLMGIHDLSERRSVEDELRKHRDRLEELVAERTRELQRQAQIIDQIHDSVISTDLQGIVTGWNKGAERQLGYPAAEALGKHISFIYPEQEQEYLQHGVIGPLLAAGDHEAEVQVRRRDGTLVNNLLSLSLVKDATDRPVGMIGYALDISARKQAEAALRQQKDALAQANQELEAFSYSVSHDLRAPLRSVDGFSQVLLEDYHDRLDEAGRDYLIRVRQAAQRMGDLIDQLLRLARLGRRQFHRTRVDLSAVAGAAWRKLADADPGRSVEIAIQPDLRAQADPHLIAILFDNLFSNAWKYTSRAPHPRVEFGSAELDGHRSYYVRDNGVGFDMRYADRLFAPFQRLHGKEFEGSGIGLATVQRIVNRHGGRLWAEAQPGEGAAFFFTLSP
jgi:PAS domain S-box-containing protein